MVSISNPPSSISEASIADSLGERHVETTDIVDRQEELFAHYDEIYDCLQKDSVEDLQNYLKKLSASDIPLCLNLVLPRKFKTRKGLENRLTVSSLFDAKSKPMCEFLVSQGATLPLNEKGFIVFFSALHSTSFEKTRYLLSLPIPPLSTIAYRESPPKKTKAAPFFSLKKSSNTVSSPNNHNVFLNDIKVLELLIEMQTTPARFNKKSPTELDILKKLTRDSIHTISEEELQKDSDIMLLFANSDTVLQDNSLLPYLAQFNQDVQETEDWIKILLHKNINVNSIVKTAGWRKRTALTEVIKYEKKELFHQLLAHKISIPQTKKYIKQIKNYMDEAPDTYYMVALQSQLEKLTISQQIKSSNSSNSQVTGQKNKI